MATPSQVRVVGCDLQDKVATFKASLDAISTVVAAWILNDENASLPADEVVKAQLAAFDALSKPAINMTDALAAVRAAT